MKGCFSKIIVFIVIIFVLYKVACFILIDLRLEDADEDFMSGIWVGKTAISEKVGDYHMILTPIFHIIGLLKVGQIIF